MDFDAVRQHLASKTGATEEYPFDPQTLVFKVGGRMFALVALDEEPPRVTLKCDPMEAKALRDAHAAVRPGYHMNKAHWNTVALDGSIADDQIQEMMDDSYALVVQTLKKAEREQLKQGGGQPT
ncbi:MAG: MmcQ/YjbR family DNA-binding protein [Armatimonadetes bacterium]|nr:MmcQ/YjbR family DNA-binding protein [Armatimonadota bacterium]